MEHLAKAIALILVVVLLGFFYIEVSKKRDQQLKEDILKEVIKSGTGEPAGFVGRHVKLLMAEPQVVGGTNYMRYVIGVESQGKWFITQEIQVPVDQKDTVWQNKNQ